MQFDLNKLKLKTSSDLMPDEQDFIIEHQEELNDEDREAYASFLPPTDTEATNTTEKPTPSSTNEPAVKEEPATVTFKTQEELDKYIDEKYGSRVKNIEEKLTTKVIPDVPSVDEPKKYITNPNSWDDVEAAIKQAKEDAKAELKAENQKEVERLENIKKEREKVVSKLKDEYSSIAKKDDRFPDVSTDEGEKKFKEFVAWGSQHKQEDLTSTYELWMKIPVKLGGGYDDVAEKKSKISQQKKAATMLGGSNKGESVSKPKTYTEIHNSDLGAVIDKRLGLS